MKALSHGPISARMASPWSGGEPDGSRSSGHQFPMYDPTEDVEERFGDCLNTTQRIRRGGRIVIKCLTFQTWLGNGFCVECWDNEVDRQGNSSRERMKGASNKDSKYLPIDISPMG